MNKEKMKLYVGSLPYDTTEEELKELFEQFGPVVSAKIVMNRDTGMSKGFGFVEMDNPDDANKAIEALNNQKFGSRTLVVNVARPPQAREEGDWQRPRQRRDRY